MSRRLKSDAGSRTRRGSGSGSGRCSANTDFAGCRSRRRRRGRVRRHCRRWRRRRGFLRLRGRRRHLPEYRSRPEDESRRRRVGSFPRGRRRRRRGGGGRRRRRGSRNRLRGLRRRCRLGGLGSRGGWSDLRLRRDGRSMEGPISAAADNAEQDRDREDNPEPVARSRRLAPWPVNQRRSLDRLGRRRRRRLHAEPRSRGIVGFHPGVVIPRFRLMRRAQNSPTVDFVGQPVSKDQVEKRYATLAGRKRFHQALFCFSTSESARRLTLKIPKSPHYQSMRWAIPTIPCSRSARLRPMR